MSYNNKQYNTRFSGRYSTSTVELRDTDVKMKEIDTSSKESVDEDSGSLPARPHWMKSKLPGVKKLSNKERRRRQNQNLRRLLTPKNALMVLNEMMPNEQVTNQFKVEPAEAAECPDKVSTSPHNFCADLNILGNNYKGYGDNKLMARNAAAEQAIRDLIIRKMNKVVNSDSATSLVGITDADEEALPMIQLASFALHKLFSEWEYEGHKVPQLKPSSLSAQLADSAAPEPTQAAQAAQAAQATQSGRRALPSNAAAMHPCMLLTYMRPHLDYRELGVEGDRPQNIMFTMGVDVDGSTYIGKAPNKKEARKLAAKTACEQLYGVIFEPPAPSAPSAQVAQVAQPKQ